MGISLTLHEDNFLKGKNFVYFYAGNNLATTAVINLILRTGKQNIVVTKVQISGSSELVTWNWFIGTEFDDQTGTKLNVIRLNTLVGDDSDADMFVNPTITAPGLPVIDGSVDSIGIQSANGEALMDDVILTESIAIKNNTSQCIKITNRQAIGTRNIEVKVHYSIM